MCFWLSTRTRNDGTFTTCLPTLQSTRLLATIMYALPWHLAMHDKGLQTFEMMPRQHMDLTSTRGTCAWPE